ncbi:MAG: hypothetical protein ACJ74J_22440 [Blastocatellia bacterium]
MLKGVHLTLLIGPQVPIPAPKAVLDALDSLEINSGKENSGFQLTFNVSKKSPLMTAMLPAGYFDPMTTRVVIIVTLNGFPNVLMDGIVTQQQLAPSNEPGQTKLTITGEDLSVLMDIVEVKIPYPGIPQVAQINLILAKYLAFGIVPVVIPPIISLIKNPTEEWDVQTSTDREFIRRMAYDCGYVFYIEPGPVPLTSIAYFGPDVRLPIPQPALNINMDAHTNVEGLSFTLNGLAKKILVMTILDPITKKIAIPVPLPNISLLRPPLGARLTPPARVEFPRQVAKLKPDQAAQKALGLMWDNADAVSASGSLDVLRYGRILRSRLLVGVRGAGLAYDGMYYVNNVSHSIKRGEYKQSFSLSRDGLISLTPFVPTKSPLP